jgi:tRNA(Ile)-lysidine synthase TilS/MesJ
VVEAVAWIFKNHNKEQLATRVEFEGNIKKPDIDIWELIGEILKNAFIQALYPSLENSVNISQLGGVKDSPMKQEMENKGGIIKNKPEPKKTKKQLRQEKRAKKKAEKEKKKADKEKQKKEEQKSNET